MVRYRRINRCYGDTLTAHNLSKVCSVLLAWMHQRFDMNGFFGFGLLILVAIPASIFAQVQPVPSTESLKEFRSRCLSLPCKVHTSPQPVTVHGTMKHGAEETAQLALEGGKGIFALIDFSISILRNKVRLSGQVSRMSENPWQLGAINETFIREIKMPDSVLSSLGSMSSADAAIIALLLAGMDLNHSYFSATDGGAPLCRDIDYGRIGSDGPLQAFFFIPWFTSDAVEECAIQHDQCYRNSPASGRDTCDQALADCVDEATGIENDVYQAIAILMISTFGSIEENQDPCQCKWEVSDEIAKKLLNADDVSSRVYGSACCNDKECKTGDPCKVEALGADGKAMVTWEGECKQVFAIQPHVGSIGSNCSICHEHYSTDVSATYVSNTSGSTAESALAALHELSQGALQ